MEPQDVEEHLRGASDAILLLIAEVEQLERHKRGVKPADPRFQELARAVRSVADSLAEFTAHEEAWANTPEATFASVEPIIDAEAAPSLAAILERWRVVERELDKAPPGSPEARRLFDEFSRLRDLYLEAFRSRDADRA